MAERLICEGGSFSIRINKNNAAPLFDPAYFLDMGFTAGILKNLFD